MLLLLLLSARRSSRKPQESNTGVLEGKVDCSATRCESGRLITPRVVSSRPFRRKIKQKRLKPMVTLQAREKASVSISLHGMDFLCCYIVVWNAAPHWHACKSKATAGVDQKRCCDTKRRPSVSVDAQKYVVACRRL